MSQTKRAARMIYVVSCRFTAADDTDRLAQWNAYYDGPKLDALLSLDGFTGSQRFRCVHALPAPYLALHTVRDETVMNDDYRGVGGGGFGGWEPYVDNWTRDLFSGLADTPDVPQDAYLALTEDEPTAAALTGIEFVWLDIAGLDRSTPRLALAVLSPADGEDLTAHRPMGLRLYRPIGPRRTGPLN